MGSTCLRSTYVLPNTPDLICMAMLCRDHIFDFHWRTGEDVPILTDPHNNLVNISVEGNIPVICTSGPDDFRIAAPALAEKQQRTWGQEPTKASETDSEDPRITEVRGARECSLRPTPPIEDAWSTLAEIVWNTELPEGTGYTTPKGFDHPSDPRSNAGATAPASTESDSIRAEIPPTSKKNNRTKSSVADFRGTHESPLLASSSIIGAKSAGGQGSNAGEIPQTRGRRRRSKRTMAQCQRHPHTRRS